MFLISLSGKDSIYEQIKKQILRFIQTGVLSPNDKLPSVRQLAGELGINPNTVQKAYQELESEGYIYTLSKKGAFVADRTKVNTNEMLRDEFFKIVARYRNDGFDEIELINIVKEVFKQGGDDTYEFKD